MFTFYGHNCFVFESRKSFLITDPWFSKTGAFFGSWFQYPVNHHLRTSVLERLKVKPVYLFVSHEHLDHFDREFILDLKPQTIFVPKYQDRFMALDLMKLGFDVRELADGIEMALDAEMNITPYISDIGVNHDSALLIKTSDGVFFNQNDCKIFDRLGEIEEQVNFYSVQFSGATWHPVCFDYSPTERMKITERKVQIKLKNVLEGIQKLGPDYFVPAAGPACFPFLNGEITASDSSIFIHQDQLDRFLRAEGIENIMYLNPGDGPSGAGLPIGPPSEDVLSSMREKLADVWAELPDVFDEVKLIRECRLRLQQIRDINIPDVPILIFSWGEEDRQKIHIDLSSKTVRRINPRGDECSRFITVSAEPKYFGLMHSGARWQDIYLSLRARVSRRPDVFSNAVNMFLFSDVSNVRQAFLKSKSTGDERIEVLDVNGQRYEINKYCPHQGADLTCAEITEDGKLICPRHGWEFDLENGGVDRRSGESIMAKKLT